MNMGPERERTLSCGQNHVRGHLSFRDGSRDQIVYYYGTAGRALILYSSIAEPERQSSQAIQAPAKDIELSGRLASHLKEAGIDPDNFKHLLLFDAKAFYGLKDDFGKLCPYIGANSGGGGMPAPLHISLRPDQTIFSSEPSYFLARWYPQQKLLITRQVEPYQLPEQCQLQDGMGSYVYLQVIKPADANALASESFFEGLAPRRPGVSPRVAVVGVGDNHGCDPRLLLEDLMQLKVVEAPGGKVAKAHISPEYQGSLLQIGDVVDIGRYSREVFCLWRTLQESSPSQVVRLLGNHELAQLIGQPGYCSRFIPDAWLQTEIRKDVLDGELKAAWCEGDTLYVHAGLSLEHFPEYRGKDLQSIVDHLNLRLMKYAGKVRLDDPQFNEMLARRDAIFDTRTGIFWIRDLKDNPEFRQVVGHSPKPSGIIAGSGLRIKFIDAQRVDPETGLDRRNPLARQLMHNSVFGMKVKE